MFLGTHAPRLDDKGRLALPARFRPDLEGGLVISKGQDHCLFVMPVAAFAEWTRKLGEASPTDKRTRDFARILFASASNEALDAQGRIVIPPSLRDYAGLVKETVVNGAHSRIEVWDSGTWENYLQAQEQAFADVAEEVLPGIF